jgi:putative membrane protein
MRAVSATIRDAFGSALPLLVILVAGLLVMPIAQWGTDQSGFMSGIILGVLLQTTVGVLFLAQAAGTRRVVGIVLIVVAVAWAAEFIGSATTVPFGGYGYTSKLQPQLLGVPLLVPLAWLMMLPPAWAVAQRITGRVSGVAFVAVSAWAFTAWDLYLDPQMVGWGLWVWDVSGPYFGIPLANFAGWLLISALITALAHPPALPQTPLIVIYALVWIIEAIGQVFVWGLRGPALFGLLGMGIFVWLAWRRRHSSSDNDLGVAHTGVEASAGRTRY